MTEIELKAHVTDKEKLIQRLNEIADYSGSVIRNDTYWKKDGIEIRIRRENFAGPENASGPQPTVSTAENILITYKRKSLRTNEDGVPVEVNDEKECTVSSAEPLEAFLTDSGFIVSLKKHKEVSDWKHSSGTTLELCTVPPLGDFLEIEILSPTDDELTVQKSREKLEELLALAGIPRNQIEKRYYSELLREAGAQ